MKYGRYKNGIILIYPQELPKSWVDEFGNAYSGFDTMTQEELAQLNFYPISVIIPTYDSAYEILVDSGWSFDTDELIFKKTFTKEDLPIELVRMNKLLQIKDDCRSRIYYIISAEHQLDIALGIMPDLGFTTWIASMIVECNRCEDAYTSATTIDELKAVVPNFPVYVAP